MDWMELKTSAEAVTVNMDALHVYAAFAIQVAAAALLRKSLAHWLPWLAVLGAELANEVMDIAFSAEPHVRGWQLASARHDILNTMVLPTLLLLLCRFAPSLFRRAKAPADPS